MTRFGFVRAAITREHEWWYGPTVMLVCVVVATALRAMFGDAAATVPFVTYFPAIMICAMLAGWRWGLTATVLSVVIADYAFIGPSFSFVTTGRAMLMGGLFVLSCAIIVAIADTLRRTFVGLERTNQRIEFLNRELRHRVRNTLAMVQALAEQTARSHPSDFMPTLNGRLQALAEANDVLSQGAEGSCELATLIAKTCAPFRHEGNIAIEGLPCGLAGDTCVPVSLAIHELCTNAVKHGALSQPGGRVFISWSEPDNGRVQIVWEEAGGPPVFPPKRKGLGTALLTSQAELQDTELEFHPRGLRCTFRIASEV